MASERIQNEYDSTRIANALDTLAENLADYTPGSPVTPTDAMKAKLPSQSTTERIAGTVEHLAENLTDLSNAVEITYAAYQALTPEEKSNGTTYYITDYPTLGGVYFFKTKEAMDAAIQAGTVPNNAVCMVDEDTPYVVKAEAVSFDNTGTGLEADNVENAIGELNSKIIHKSYYLDNNGLHYEISPQHYIVLSSSFPFRIEGYTAMLMGYRIEGDYGVSGIVTWSNYNSYLYCFNTNTTHAISNCNIVIDLLYIKN